MRLICWGKSYKPSMISRLFIFSGSRLTCDGKLRCFSCFSRSFFHDFYHHIPDKSSRISVCKTVKLFGRCYIYDKIIATVGYAFYQVGFHDDPFIGNACRHQGHLKWRYQQFALANSRGRQFSRIGYCRLNTAFLDR